ncbi:MAG: acetyl-CoA carboxylase biotin carboxyl carrier protein subunit [Firmicutes bacterium]|nr:acetyl-CoA carboxylase biotin carboxyl carrier protein subunit [Bacillota bacterium]
MAEVRAEMSGVLASWKVAVGDRVGAQEEIGVLESMKMQIPILSPQAGEVAELRASPGDFVQEGDTLAVVAP